MVEYEREVEKGKKLFSLKLDGPKDDEDCRR